MDSENAHGCEAVFDAISEEHLEWDLSTRLHLGTTASSAQSEAKAINAASSKIGRSILKRKSPFPKSNGVCAGKLKCTSPRQIKKVRFSTSSVEVEKAHIEKMNFFRKTNDDIARPTNE